MTTQSDELLHFRPMAGSHYLDIMLNRIAALLLLTLLACQHQPSASLSWASVDLAGLTIELVDSAREERLKFSKDGHGVATLGSKGGAVTTPAFRWRIVDGRLQIGDGVTFPEELTLLSRTPSTLVAGRRSGAVVEYKILDR